MEQMDIKIHLLNTTIKLIEDGCQIDAITIRKIAMRGNFATGLINYHFGSKDKLIVNAVEKIINKESIHQSTMLKNKDIKPRSRLVMFLLQISQVVMQYREYSLILLKHELFSNSFETPKYIFEILKEIEPLFSEAQLKWLSIQIVAPLQYIFLKEDGFYKYMEINAAQMEDLLENLIEDHLNRLGIK